MGARPRTSCTLACPGNTPVAAPAYASGRQTASGFSPCSGADVWSVVTKRLGATRWKHGTGAGLASEDSGAPDILYLGGQLRAVLAGYARLLSPRPDESPRSPCAVS